MSIANKHSVTIDPAHHGLKQHEMKTSTVLFMIFCLTAGGAAILTGPIMYFIFKRKYGGMTKIDPITYPANPRTGLGIGDTRRMAWLFGAMTFIGLIAIYFMPWYESPEYYTQTYGIDGLFNILMSSIRWITVASGILTTLLLVAAIRVEPKTDKYTLTSITEL